MKKILLLNSLLLLFFAQKAKCDRIIFNGDTITLNAKSLLSKYPGFKSLQSKLIDYKGGCYDAEWTITNRQLYLTNVYSCSENKKQVKENINALFHANNGKVKADWVTKNVWFPAGKPVRYPNNFTIIYSAETRASVVNGELAAVKRFNYANSRASIYDEDRDARTKFVSAHINWHHVPRVKYLLIAFEVQTGTDGKAEILKEIDMPGNPPHSKLYEAELIRIIKLLPLGVYYWHGKVFHEKMGVAAIFSRPASRL